MTSLLHTDVIGTKKFITVTRKILTWLDCDVCSCVELEAQLPVCQVLLCSILQDQFHVSHKIFVIQPSEFSINHNGCGSKILYS